MKRKEKTYDYTQAMYLLDLRDAEGELDWNEFYQWILTYQEHAPCIPHRTRGPEYARFTLKQITTIKRRMRYYRLTWGHLMLPGESMAEFGRAFKEALTMGQCYWDQFIAERRGKC
jgi:hypothetical protein